MHTLPMKHSLSQLFKPACCVTVALMRVGQEMTLHKHLVCACGSSFGRQLAHNALQINAVRLVQIKL